MLFTHLISTVSVRSFRRVGQRVGQAQSSSRKNCAAVIKDYRKTAREEVTQRTNYSNDRRITESRYAPRVLLSLLWVLRERKRDRTHQAASAIVSLVCTRDQIVKDPLHPRICLPQRFRVPLYQDKLAIFRLKRFRDTVAGFCRNIQVRRSL